MARKSSRTLWAQKLTGKLPAVKDAAWGTDKKVKKFEGLVLGIDPSLRGTGLALVSYGKNGESKLHKSHTVRNSSSISMPKCLAKIFRAVDEMLELSDEINHVVLEQTIYVQNFQTAQILGAARGAAISAASLRDLPIFEYPPLRIKQAVVGYGKASKDQVIKMVMQHLRHPDPLPSDEADAVAVALCHAMTWKG